MKNQTPPLCKVTHKELTFLGEKWLKKRGAGVVMREIRAYTRNNENPDIIGWVNSTSVMIECKTSRADFHADKKKLFRRFPEKGMGDFRIYLCPEGIIKPEDLPENWGLLWYDGKRIKTIHGMPKSYRITGWSYDTPKFEKCLQSEHDMLYSGCRRLATQGFFDKIYDSSSVIVPSQTLQTQKEKLVD